MIRKLLSTLALIAFGLTFGVIMSEIFIRVGFDMLPPQIQGDIQHVRRVPWDDRPILMPMPFEPSTTYQSVIAPGYEDYPLRWMDAEFRFSTISLWEHPVGLRTDPEPRWPVEIMAFGDSFTFCWTDVDDCWVQRLGSEYGWSVLNAGQPGTGPGGQVELIETVGVPIEPKLVAWQWYSNDAVDDHVLASIRGEIDLLPGAPPANPVRQPRGLARYSALAHLIDLRIDPPEKVSPYQHNQTIQVRDRWMLVNTDEYVHPSNPTYANVQDGFPRNLDHYQQGHDLLADIGAVVVIVLIPTKEEVYAEFLVDILGQEYLDAAAQLRQDMLVECESRGWRCLDTTPALREAVAGGVNVFHAFDFHLDASGNGILAGLVNDYIVENGLLD
jgi:hypothetical protein